MRRRIWNIAENTPIPHADRRVRKPLAHLIGMTIRFKSRLAGAAGSPWSEIGRIVARRSYIETPASGNTRCRIAARQISTTSSLSRFAKRASLTNLSMAQKQIAPTTQMIRTPIKTESIATPCVGTANAHAPRRIAGSPIAPRRMVGICSYPRLGNQAIVCHMNILSDTRLPRRGRDLHTFQMQTSPR
jgi:hypothetical protein